MHRTPGAPYPYATSGPAQQVAPADYRSDRQARAQHERMRFQKVRDGDPAVDHAERLAPLQASDGECDTLLLGARNQPLLAARELNQAVGEHR